MMSTIINFIFKGRKSRKISPVEPEPRITELSEEIRLKIWEKLSVREQKNLRRVCKLFQADIDQSIGVHGILKYSLPNLAWIQNARLNSLLVQNLLHSDVTQYLKTPFLLQKLTIANSIISAANLQTLLQELTNLKELSLVNIPKISESFPDFESFRNSKHVLLALNELPLFLGTVNSNPRLDTLSLDFNTKNTEVVASRQMDEDELQTIDWHEVGGNNYSARLKHLSIQICDRLGYGHNMAFQRNDASLVSRALREWLRFLSVQDRLETFISSLGILNWSYYQPVLSACCATLTRIDLQAICTPRDAEPLDLGFFKKFPNLTFFRLTARSDYDFNFLPAVNFSAFPVEQLELLELSGVELTEEDLYDALYCTRSKLKFLKLERNFMFRMDSLFIDLLRSIQHRQFECVTIRQSLFLYEYQSINRGGMNSLCNDFGYVFNLRREHGEGVLEIKQRYACAVRRGLIRAMAQKLNIRS